MPQQHEPEPEMIERLQRVTDQLSTAIRSVECDKEEMAYLLIAQGSGLLSEVHGQANTSRYLYVIACQLFGEQEVISAAQAAVDALRKAGANLN